ncbi:hypothetical protein [Magnetospira sp. QH-2]|uniref:hypothetical protein n=1 Tax=Magnetospira sp. (strain QH-2) TaxID=1288970 RepID=UPI0003E814CD|nr:hypothetical protein [Magnetospira sp. QH-2]CCQ73928.1 Protein of unknown function [Magnetospira sp. QH-2]
MQFKSQKMVTLLNGDTQTATHTTTTVFRDGTRKVTTTSYPLTPQEVNSVQSVPEDDTAKSYSSLSIPAVEAEPHFGDLKFPPTSIPTDDSETEDSGDGEDFHRSDVTKIKQNENGSYVVWFWDGSCHELPPEDHVKYLYDMLRDLNEAKRMVH